MDSRFADLLEKGIRELRALIVALPRERVLPVGSAQSIKQEMIAALDKGDVLSANRVFWMDQVQTLDVWRSIFIWRISEQVEATYLLRSTGKMVAAAAVCRSAFELAGSGLITSAKLYEVLKKIKDQDMRTSPITSETFPVDVERAIFGTRIAEFTKENRFPTQTNFLTHLDRLQRHKLGGEISKYYELLCDMTHPNLGGNRPFFRVAEGNTIVRASQEYDQEWLNLAQSTIDSTLSWTALNARNVFIQSGEGIGFVRRHFFGTA